MFTLLYNIWGGGWLMKRDLAMHVKYQQICWWVYLMWTMGRSHMLYQWSLDMVWYGLYHPQLAWCSLVINYIQFCEIHIIHFLLMMLQTVKHTLPNCHYGKYVIPISTAILWDSHITLYYANISLFILCCDPLSSARMILQYTND